MILKSQNITIISFELEFVFTYHHKYITEVIAAIRLILILVKIQKYKHLS